MPLPPSRYGEILKEKIKNHNVDCWLVNTGWTGGGYGVGKRMPIGITRSIIDKILDGSMTKCITIIHDKTGLSIPVSSEIPREVLIPELGWVNQEKYKNAASELSKKFENQKNINK